MLNNIVSYLQNTRAELTKVVWPSRQDVIRLTVAVILMSVIIGSTIGGLDYLFTKITTYLLK